jgi:YVTN family beta-propeller protein
MTLDPVTHRAYVANQLNFVQKIDVGSAALAATIVTAAEAAPGVVNPNNHLFYASRTVATTDVQFFNKCGASSTVAGLPHGSGRYLFPVINRNTNRIYFLNTASNLAGDAGSIPGFVSVIDGNSNSIIANIEAGNQPFGMDINETTNKIYVLNANLGVDFPGSITVIDGATNTATSADTSAFPVTARFFGATAVNETTNKFYFQVSNPDSNIGVLDGATNIATPLSASLGPVSVIRVNKILNRVYVGTNTGLLHVLDGATDALITTLTVGSPSAAVGIQRNIAVNETTGQVFVADFNNDTVSVIEGSANTIVATIPVGDGPTSVAVNQLSNRVYVGNTNGKTISFIDGESLAVGSTLSLPLQPAFLAVDADVSRVYTSSGDAPDLSGVTVISDVDGTFDSLRQAIIAATVGDPPGIRNSMLAKVDNAEAAFENGHTQAAINVLHALEHQVEAQRGKRLTHAEADHIRALIAAIINSVWRNS